MSQRDIAQYDRMGRDREWFLRWVLSAELGVAGRNSGPLVGPLTRFQEKLGAENDLESTWGGPWLCG